MARDHENVRRCPRCEVCGVAIRVRGIEREGAWCKNCISAALPFVGLVSEGEFRSSIREYREGLQSKAGDFQGLRLDPFDDELRGTLSGLDNTLRGCAYMGGEEIRGCLKKASKEGGCSLSLLCHNIRSAKGPGLELLEAEIRRWGVSWDIIGLTETWLDTESEKRISVQGYRVICASRKNKSGGGVAALIKEDQTYRERPDLSIFKEGLIESVFVELIREGRKNDLIGVVYRPPGGNLVEFNKEISKILSLTKSDSCFIMGDFNVDLLKLNKHTPTNEFMSEFTTQGFFPLISLPTRLTDTTATLIDNIWTNKVDAQMKTGLVTVRISDHLPIFSFTERQRDSEEREGKKKPRRKVTEHRIARFAEQLETWSFDEERAKGVDYNVAKFRNQFRDMYNENFPIAESKKSAKDREKPWLDNDEFKDLIEAKGRLYKRKLKGLLAEDEVRELQEINKEVNRKRKALKRQYFKEKLDERIGNLRKTWEVLGEALTGRKGKDRSSTCRYFFENKEGITDGQKIAQGFCDFYCQVGPKLAAKIKKEQRSYREFMGEPVQESFILTPTTPQEIEDLCLALDPGKGIGWDEVSPKVIKGVAKELSGSLSRLYNCCMREGYYPKCFKVARVVPVFKAEDPTDFSNYRPVSVLPVLSQVFEKVIRSRLVRFLDRNEVIIPGQYGFRSGHSTAMAILDMVEKVRGAWEQGNVALGVLIDLKKAFDTVDHSILLAKLEHYGIRGASNKLMSSYLEDRTQYVVYDGYESDRGQLSCGVPQGSVLGPLFFLLYVNDMVKACPELELVLFADDTNIFAQGKETTALFEQVNVGLNELSRWFRCNKLTLNLKKTEYVFFGGPKYREMAQVSLEIGGETIRRVEGSRFLGVWIDQELRWTNHINNVTTKISQLLGVIGRVSSVLGGNTLRTLYNGLVLPHLQYCLIVWGDFAGGRNKTLADKLLKLQKRFVGMIAETKGRYHSDPLFARFGILKMDDLYRQQLRMYAWRFWKGCLPEGQASLYQRTVNVHEHATRSAGSGISILTRDHGSIKYRMPKEWSTISDELKECRSIAAFKGTSKKQLIEQYRVFECRELGCLVCGRE